MGLVDHPRLGIDADPENDPTAHEVSGKALDFSPASVARRWESGERDMDAVLDRINAGEIEIGVPGLTVVTVAMRCTRAATKVAT